MQVTVIAGARPNFMKVAPIIKAIEQWNQGKTASNPLMKDGEQGRHPIQYRLVHTGQHYDKNMSDTFFEELGIPAPDVNLGCGGGTQAEQTAAIMVAFEKELSAHPADIVMVVGDVIMVQSTLRLLFYISLCLKIITQILPEKNYAKHWIG